MEIDVSEKLTFAALSAAVIFSVSPALADGHGGGDDKDGFGYVSVAGGLSALDDFQGTPTSNAGIPAALHFEQDAGFAVSAAAGYAFRLSPELLARAELEYAHRNNEIDEFVVNGGNVNGNGPFDGAWNIHTIMINGFAEYDTGGRFRPYIGVGVGVAIIETDDIFYATGGGVRINLEDQDEVFAAQGVIGANYELNANFDLFADLRYLATAEAEFNRIRPSDGVSTPHEGDFNAFSANLGVRLKF